MQQILEGGVAPALGELADDRLLVSVFIQNRLLGFLILEHGFDHNGRQMQIDRRLPAEGLVEQVVFRRGGEVFRAAHDVADGHQVIVHDVGEVVGRQAVGLDEHVVIQRVAIHLDVAVEHVVEGRFARGRHVLADDVGLARRDAALGFLKADVVQALFVVFVGFALGLGGLAVGLDLFLGAEAAVSAALFDQLPSELGVEVAALGLDIRAVFAAHIRALVVGQTGLTHGFIDQIDRAGHLALLIGILDAQNELAAVLLGEQIGIQRGAQAAQMQIARRAGRKSRANFIRHDVSSFYPRRNFVPVGTTKGLSDRPLETFGCKSNILFWWTIGGKAPNAAPATYSGL